MLRECWDDLDTSSLICSREELTPYPVWNDRASWEAVHRDAARVVCARARAFLPVQWNVLPATRYMEFVREGNRSRYEAEYRRRREALSLLVITECIEGNGELLDSITDTIWAIAEESTWVIPAHNRLTWRRSPDPVAFDPLPDTTDPEVDLMAAETGTLFAVTKYLLAGPLSQISGEIVPRLEHETNVRIVEPFLNRNDFWWMGFREGANVNNWNPWCVSNCLLSLLLLVDDPDVRLAGVEKSLDTLDRFLSGYDQDGGCDEGPKYWTRAGASLFDCLETLRLATGGVLDWYDQPLIRAIADYFPAMHVRGDWFFNFADGPPRFPVECDLVYRFGSRVGNTDMQRLALERLHAYGPESVERIGMHSINRVLPAVLSYREEVALELPPGDGRKVVVLPDTEVVTATGIGGFDFAVKGGHNDESHNHNDVGNVIVFHEGKPLLIDAGVGEYSAKTFGPDRYELWTMQSSYHNLPEINRVRQSAGAGLRTGSFDFERGRGSDFSVSIELSRAYPSDAGIESLKRRAGLENDGGRFSLREEWKLDRADSIVFNLLSSYKPMIKSSGQIAFEHHDCRMTITGHEVNATVERLILEDGKLRDSWGEAIFRLRLEVCDPPLQGALVLTFA